jgi:hypothetical protein
MLYRFALALGLLALGVHVGREITRTKPVRAELKQARVTRPTRLTTPRTSKVSLH